jgi:hypothetical protein
MLRQVGLHTLVAQPIEVSFDDGGRRQKWITSGLVKIGLNSIIVLGAWTICKHHNKCVFDGISPSLAEVLALAAKENRQWVMAGAHRLSHLTPTLSSI